MEQPPSRLHCNPYNRLTTVCRVEGPPQKFSIMWLRDGTGEFEGGGMEVRRSSRHIRVHQTNSNYTTEVGQVEFVRVASRLSISPVREEDAGQYWCQVLLANGTLLTERSNTLTLSTEEAYNSFAPCKNVNSITQRDCATPNGPNTPTSILTTTAVESQSPTTHTSHQQFFTANDTLSPPSPETPIAQQSSYPAIVTHSVLTAVLIVCTLTVVLIFIAALLRHRHCTGPSVPEGDTHYEDIDNINTLDKTATAKQTQTPPSGEYDDIDMPLKHKQDGLQAEPTGNDNTLDKLATAKQTPPSEYDDVVTPPKHKQGKLQVEPKSDVNKTTTAKQTHPSEYDDIDVPPKHRQGKLQVELKSNVAYHLSNTYS